MNIEHSAVMSLLDPEAGSNLQCVDRRVAVLSLMEARISLNHTQWRDRAVLL